MKRLPRPLPPLEYLLECFDADLERGTLTWKVRPRHHFKHIRHWNAWNTAFAGTPALHSPIRAGSYFTGSINRRTYNAHRILWKMRTGEDPNGEIDHIDGNRQNNAASNLRCVSRMINARNAGMRSDNSSGIVGVCWDKRRGRWFAEISNRKLGRFDTIEEAIAARQAASEELGFHPNHGSQRLRV